MSVAAMIAGIFTIVAAELANLRPLRWLGLALAVASGIALITMRLR